MATIRKRESGKYQVQIRLKDLPVITKTFAKMADARDFIREVESDTELARKLGKAAQEIPGFQQLVDEYMAQYTGRDPSAAGRLSFWCKRYKNTPITKLDEDDVDDGLQELAKGRTGSTVNRYKSNLSAVFIFFIRHPDYKKLAKAEKFTNPVRKESVSTYKENPHKNRFLTQDEQQSLLEQCRASHWDKLYLLVLMALTTGARKGELLGLKWSDINFQERTAKLHQGMTKNTKPRLLPLTPPVIEELMKFRENTDHLVFHSTVSKSIPFDIKKAWLKALEVSEIGHCRFHDLRHSAASNLVRAGRTLFEVSVLLGHSSTTMTARYSHLAVHDTQNMVDTVMGQLR